MSYSRWSYSAWYTYWDGMASGELPDEQVMSVRHVGGGNSAYRYGDDPADMFDHFGNATPEELEELMEYIDAFRADVRGEFPQ